MAVTLVALVGLGVAGAQLGKASRGRAALRLLLGGALALAVTITIGAITGNAVHVVGRCREKGLLLSVAGVNVVRFAPPYIVERFQIEEAVTILRGVLAEGVGKATP